ncbi:hypothetical protein K491DRAFT_698537 [Lophiostoma macrostomum CBS 122681]|uniref:F-box domain-containing protein n=1 Tax=Lophiostoma macrostomum CBS 122681 TaxID=1314788 RepID=A0A6A6SPK2_9PLEO|nr:hypothetical protein K491DRAFT_698537 [Lophiostoma macrostomum CBS 122681]
MSLPLASGRVPAEPPHADRHTDVNASSSLYEPQPDSRLLSLPAEIRLHIWEYMTLSPVTEDSLHWTGAFFTCRQMQLELKKESQPQHLATHIACGKAVNEKYPEVVKIDSKLFMIDATPSTIGLIRRVTLHVYIEHVRLGSFAVKFHEILVYLYKFFLDSLTINFVGESEDFSRTYLPYGGGIKGLRDSLFYDYVTRGQINCKSVTFSLDQLANVEGGRSKKVPLRISHGTQDISWTMVIMQDDEENQTERQYASPSRFRPESLSEPAPGGSANRPAAFQSPINEAASDTHLLGILW